MTTPLTMMLSKRPIIYFHEIRIALGPLFARVVLSSCQTRVGLLYMWLSSERPRVVRESVNKLFPFHELINVARVWPPCCAMLRHAGFIVGSNLTVFKLYPACRNTSAQHATGWPNARNMLRPINNVAICCIHMLRSFVRGFTRVLIWKIIGAVLSF